MEGDAEEEGQHANTLLAYASESSDVLLAFVNYNWKKSKYYIVAECNAACTFLSCFNRSAVQQFSKIRKMAAKDSSPFFHPIGYIGDAVAAIRACLLLQQQNAPTRMHRTVANPLARFETKWRQPNKSCCHLNKSQRRALCSLHYNLEVIQGPPGTGKSTTILHLVMDCMPQEMKLVVCAVQNRAVESICQKFASAEAGELKFFVHGNIKRLAPTSKKWTLEAQADRDPQVV
jgi:hypothetical protein